MVKNDSVQVFLYSNKLKNWVFDEEIFVRKIFLKPAIAYLFEAFKKIIDGEYFEIKNPFLNF